MSLPHRPSMHPGQHGHSHSASASSSSAAATAAGAGAGGGGGGGGGGGSGGQHAQQSAANRARQYTHLNAQLAQLNAHLADTENLLRMTAVQAEYMRSLGGWCGGLFMASAKILGEETVAGGGMNGDAARAEVERERERAHESSVFEQSTGGAGAEPS